MKPIDKLKAKLAELFQLDQADLDFGIYRIMNAKRGEITRFLEKDLLPQVEAAFKEYKSSDKAEIQKELDKVIEGVKAAGMDPEQAPKVQELRRKLAEEAVDVTALQNDVFSHLYDFFARYYDEGDFISLRRYKEGVYAIPYEGEEVKLHWANHDQYYIKTTEYFRDYTFRLPDGRRVHFKIIEADTEKDNVKTTNGKDRRFFLLGEKPVSEENKELVIRFEYRMDSEKHNQDFLNSEAVKTILSNKKADAWAIELSKKWVRADGMVTERTVLEKHLSDYTKRNTFDYFIHKDLGRFLRRELDFYIKNEVMHLDDVENESALRVDQYLSKIRVIRKIAHKIIDFLAQIENFQKRLWLKKKFVIETNYCVTLDRVPEALYPKIAKNDAQREEWVRLFAIDEIKGDLTRPAYSKALTVKFLKANPHLILDTKFFDQKIKEGLLASFDDVEDNCDGVLIQSDNFHALNLLLEMNRDRVTCLYADPPYNADASPIMYKNEFLHSSWLALMYDRLQLARLFLTPEATACVTIDDYELHRLTTLLDGIFSPENRLATVVIRNNPSGRSTVKGFSINHEYGLFYSRTGRSLIGRLPHTEDQKSRYDETNEAGQKFEWENFRKSSSGSRRTDRPKQYFPIYYSQHSNSVRIPVIKWQDQARSWEITEEPRNGEVAIWPKDSDGSERVWRYGIERTQGQLANLSVKEMDGRLEIYTPKYFQDKGILPRTWWDKPDYSARDNGTRALANLFGAEKSFDFPKAPEAVKDCLRVSALGPDGVVLDFFAGSGTTGHAAIDLNREDNGKRKYILVEMGYYFDTVLKPRIQKVVYSKDWKDGKPISRDGVSHMFKYIRLESYEDALANLNLKRTKEQELALDKSEAFRETYMLRYMLDAEAKGSSSLLDLDRFEDPFSYQLLIGTGSVGETKPVPVDLVETFNWLLGLKVKHMDCIEGFRIVEGTSPKGEKVLVIWRKIRELAEKDPKILEQQRGKANEDLEKFFRKQQYNTMDMEFDIVYVNGDNNLMNLPMAPEGGEPRYKVRLIEEEFKRLMFDVEDV